MPHRTGIALVLATLTLAAWGSTSRAARPASPSVVGTWQVVDWWVLDAKSGERQHPYGRQPAGFYVFDATGHVFVHVARSPEASRLAPGRWRTLPADELRAMLEQRLAYFGSYSVDAARGIVSEHVESDLARELAGTTRNVPYRLDGDRLLLGDGSQWQAVLMRSY
jgi:hypothetical protein